MMNAIGIVKSMRPGDDIETRCGKCKDMRTHVIIAVSPQGQVERVRCRTCNSEHNYRAPAKTTKRTSAAGTSTRSGGTSKSAVVPNGPTQIYSPQQSFRTGDQISHATFGIGLVVDVREKKIDVKFGRESKILVHAG